MKKKEMTSFDIAAIVVELDQSIKGAYIDNIYQIDPQILLLKLRQPGKTRLHLLIEAGKRLHLTSYTHEKPKRPSSFCMALRKYLRSGVVHEIRQHQFERIVTLRVNTKTGILQLISELFGDGNIILVDPQNRILHALTYRRMRDRNILRSEVFQQAPSSGRNPLELDREEFSRIRELGSLEIVRALTRFLSIGGHYAEEILLRAGVDRDVPCTSLTEKDLGRIFDQLSEITSRINVGSVDPRVVVNDEGGWIDVTPFPLKIFSHLEQKQYSSLNQALDEYYVQTAMKQEVVKVSERLDREVAKQERILQNQQRALEDAKTKIEPNRRIGDMIYIHFNSLQYLVKRINEEKKRGKSWPKIVSDLQREKEAGIVPATYFHSMDPKRFVINVSVEDLTFPLSLHRSVQDNAATYYDRAKKAEKKLKGTHKALAETQARIKQLQRKQVISLKKTRKPPPKIRKKAWYEKFRWFYCSDGLLVIGGRDAITNEILIKKHMEPRDIVFHADIPGAPFVLIKTGGGSPSERTIKEAAQLAASYSRAWKESFTALDVYWIYPEQIDKSPPPGQYLRKGSFMVHGSKNYIRNVPLKVAVGIKGEDDHLLVIGGPAQAISKQATVYVELEPGEQKSRKLAHRIRQELAEKGSRELRKQIAEIPVENIQRLIPFGRGRIT